MNMAHGVPTNDPVVGDAFRSTLNHQLLIVLLLVTVLAIAWNTARTLRFRRHVAAGTIGAPPPDVWPYPEPAARRLLRISFGIIWIFDGILQAQGSMPLGLTGQVITPAASSSPGWVQHLVNFGVTIWNNHPVSAAAATVWIQVGIGAFLLVAPRGRWSRTAGLVSAGWGLVVWVFGEAFGGILGHGSSWLFGAPGAAVFYIAGGLLVALADRAWETPRLGKAVLRVTGLFFVGMSILQAWPGRGFWTGQPHPTSTPGTLTAMESQMSALSQPSLTASWVRDFGSFDAAHGWAVNLVAVVLLATIGALMLTGRRGAARVGVAAAIVLCLADWVLVEDFGFFGGVGTDPNSMIPMALFFTSGYLAMVRLPVRAAVPATPPATPATEPVPSGPPARLLDRLSPSYLIRSIAAIGAVGIVLVGAAPMALAATNPHADPVLTEAANGTPNDVDSPAPPFSLTDQDGRTVSLAGLAGHTVVLTFLDPVCVSDCPLIAQELRVTDRMIGRDAADVDLVAIVANPLYRSTATTLAFTKQEGLEQLSNWHFVTGTLPELESAWNNYGIEADISPAGAMVADSDLVYVIDRTGHLRVVIGADPGGLGDSALHSSFSTLLAAQVHDVVHS